MSSLRYLLDTNVISELVRNPQGTVRDRIVAIGEAAACTSIIVAAELRYGALRRNSARLTRQVEAILGAIEILPFESPMEETYARTRLALEKSGVPIGANDLLIASHALHLGAILVTANTREFQRVRGLRIEDWTPTA